MPKVELTEYEWDSVLWFIKFAIEDAGMPVSKLYEKIVDQLDEQEY